MGLRIVDQGMHPQWMQAEVGWFHRSNTVAALSAAFKDMQTPSQVVWRVG